MDLKSKLSELEQAIRTKHKSAIAALESKVQSLEEQNDIESRERAEAKKQCRRLDKRLKEAINNVDDERRGRQDQQQGEVFEEADRRVRGGAVEAERGEEEADQGGGGPPGAGGDPAEGKHPAQEQSQTWRRLRSLFAFRTPSNDTPVVLLRFFLRQRTGRQKIHPLLPKGPGVKISSFFTGTFGFSSSFFR